MTFGAALAAAVLPAPARADAPETINPPTEPPLEPTSSPLRADHGASFGLRLGWAFPLGSMAMKDKLADNFSGMLPIWVDVGYRFSRPFYLGVFAQWAPAFVSETVCPPLLRCSANDFRLGIDAHLGLATYLGLSGVTPVDPWVGLGIGYEATTTKVSAAGTQSQVTDRAFEFGNVQLGLDYTGAEPWRVGAFFTLTLAEYLRQTVTVPTGESAHSVVDPALHLWLMVGVRGRYDL